MYTLRFPLTVPPGREITVTGTAREVDGLTVRFTKQDRFYVLTFSGFPSEEAAETFLKQIRAGLLWVLLHTDIAADAVFEPQQVIYPADPREAASNMSGSLGLTIEGPVDALLDGAQPAIYATTKQVRVLTGGVPNVVSSLTEELVLNDLTKGLRIENVARISDDEKLLTAFELYAASFSETSPRARFLSLVMALETLAIGLKRTPVVLGLLQKWTTEVDEILKAVQPESDDATSLQDIRRALRFAREDSIRSRVRSLVLNTLRINGDHDFAEAAKKARDLYDLRSTLVHEGSLPAHDLSKALGEAKCLVQRVLRARFLLVAAGTL